KVRYEVVEKVTADALGFDPAAGSKRGHVACRICGATVTADYVKAEGRAGRLGIAPLAAVVLKREGRGREYLPAGSYPLADDERWLERLAKLPVEPPTEALPPQLTGGMCTAYGFQRFCDLFTPRQLLALCTLVAGCRETYHGACEEGVDADRATAIVTALAIT